MQNRRCIVTMSLAAIWVKSVLATVTVTLLELASYKTTCCTMDTDCAVVSPTICRTHCNCGRSKFSLSRTDCNSGPLCKAAVGSIHRTIDLKFTHVVSDASNYSRCHIIDCSGAETLTLESFQSCGLILITRDQRCTAAV
ncbi:hypothetical protein M405DRAFT_286392 [Rhizopogon salebrosus TDB-379]|nr:hypothetical protein M405DRAFT_286392 [Rhizopogon salebrosus TDB-379]